MKNKTDRRSFLKKCSLLPLCVLTGKTLATQFIVAGSDPNEPVSPAPELPRYVLTGSCSKCGQCCRAGFISKIMCVKNNLIDGVHYCDFLTKQPDGKFYCSMIVEAKTVDIAVDISKVLDEKIITEDMRTSLDMTDEQVKWACSVINFPDPNKNNWRDQLDNKKWWGLDKCTFSYEEAV